MIILNRTCRAICTNTLLLFACILFTNDLFAASLNSNQYRLELPLNTPLSLDTPLKGQEQVAENFHFVGLARYLNSVSYFLIDNGARERLDSGNTVPLNESQYFVATGRFNALVLKAPQNTIEIKSGSQILIHTNDPNSNLQGWLLPKSELGSIDPNLNQLRYAQLPKPFALLARLLEWLLINLQKLTHIGWGWSVVLFAAVINLLLLPVTRFATRLQRTVSAYQGEMKPLIDEIKKEYRGEEAHKRIMALYKERNITPFYTLKPMLSLFIQIPILIAIFNILGEMYQFSNQSFLWVENMAIPDAFADLTVTIPFFGDTLNTIPLLMAFVAAVSALKYRDPHTPKNKFSRQKQLQLLAMGIVFLILFYPFPAAMTLYWLTANLLHMLKH